MQKFLRTLMLVAAMLLPLASHAQLNAVYLFSTGVDNSQWYTLTADSTVLKVGSNNDSYATPLTDIGFTFTFAGSEYTQFSANSDGTVRLGSTVIGTGAYSNPFSASYAGTNAPKICGLGCDGYLVAATDTTPADYIAYQLFGTAGNRVLVIEISTGTYNSNTRHNHYTFQVQLAEADNSVTLVYSPVAPAAAPYVAYQLGASANANDIVLFNVADNTMSTYSAGTTDNNAANTWPEPGRYYTIAPDPDACGVVGNLTVSNVTSTSAYLTWSGDAVGYRVYWDESDTNGTYYSTPYAYITSLEPNTEYTFGVASVCADGAQSVTLPVTFRTNCAPEAFPFTETFDATLAENTCWGGNSSVTAAELINGAPMVLGANSVWTYSSSESNGLAAGHYRVNIYGASCKKWMVTPAIDLSDATAPVVSFDAAFTKYTGTGAATGFENNASQHFMIFVQTEYGWDTSNYYEINLASIASATYINQIVDLSLYAGQTIRLGFYAQSTTSGGDNNLHIDNIAVMEAPSCMPVTGLEVSNVTSSSALLTWEGQADSYFILDMADSTVVGYVTSGTQYSLSLEPNTHYVFGVMAFCGDDESTIASISFRTECDAISLPWTCSFEEGEIMGTATSEALPWCSYRLASTATSSNYPYAYNSATNAHSGARSLYFYGSTSSSYPDTMALILPELDVQTYPMNGNRVSFWAKMSSTSYVKAVYVGTMSDPTDASTLTLFDSVLISSTIHTKYTVSLANAIATDAHLVLAVMKGSGTVYLDDVTFELTPACPEVPSLYVTDVTSNTVTVQWQPSSSNVNYYSLYRVDDDGSMLQYASGWNDTVFTFDSYLEANTEYTFAVEASCTGGNSPLTTVTVRTLPEPITCGNNEATIVANADTVTSTTNYCPGYSYYNYSYSEVIIPASRLEGIIEIKGMQFNVTSLNTGSSYFNDCEIYLMNTTAENLSDGFIQDPANFQLVYSGDLNHDATGWHTVNFDNSFFWDGVDNLLVAVRRNHGAYAASGSFASYQDEQLRARYVYNDNAPYTIGEITSAGSIVSNVPVYRFIGCNSGCLPVSLPLVESFEEDSPTVDCWEFVSMNTSNDTGAANGMGFYVLNDNRVWRFSSYYSASDYNQYGYSPRFHASPTATTLNVKVRFATYGSSDHLTFGYVVGNQTIWDDEYYTASDDYQYYEAVIPATATRLAINYYGNYAYYAWIDSVWVTEMTGDYCYPANNIAIDELTSTTAVLTWGGEADSYWVSVSDDSNEVYDGMVNGYSVALNNLTPETFYNVDIYALCGNDETSNVVNYTFYTGYCIPTPSSMDGSGITNVTFGGMTNTVHPTSAGYANYSSMEGSVAAGTTATVDITYATGYSYGTIIWVDWNNNMLFEGNEVVYVGQSTNANPTVLTAAFDIPATVPTGSYRMRILGADMAFDSYTSSIEAAANANPCETYSWGVAEDYTLVVTEVPNCLAVTNVYMSEATATSVTISWTDELNDGATYSIYNTSTDELIASGVTGTSYTITGLTPLTPYAFGVVANCSANDASTIVTTGAITECNTGSCDIYVVASDSYGDGWNGASLWFHQNGIVQDVYSMSTGYDDTVAITLCAEQPILINWVSGQYDGEVGIEIFNANGTLVYSHEQGTSITNYATLIQLSSCTSIPTRTISVYANDTTMGYVIGGGEYAMTDTAFTVQAFPYEGYYLEYWLVYDGSGNYLGYVSGYNNPWTYYCNDNYTIYGMFAPIDTVTVTFAVNAATMGTTIPAPGTYQFVAGSTFQVEAIPEDGYYFSHWNVSYSTDSGYVSENIETDANSLFYYVYANWAELEDLTFTAYFEGGTVGGDSVMITFAVNDTTMGTTSPAPGTYVYTIGDYVSAEAIPASGYHFTGWTMSWNEDGEFFTEVYPYSTITLGIYDYMLELSQLTLIANFEANMECSGTTCTLTITGYDSYGDGWNGGSLDLLQNNTLVGVMSLEYDSVYTSSFEICNDYPLYLVWNTGSWDSEVSFTISDVTGNTLMDVSNVTTFDDGEPFAMIANVCTNPVVTYLATIDSMMVILGVNDSTLGSITPAPGVYYYGEDETIHVVATPAQGSYFLGWAYSYVYQGQTYYDTVYNSLLDTLNESASYWLEVTPVTFIALFGAPDTLTVTMAVNDATMGTTVPAPGVHQFFTGSNLQFEALPNNGYQFSYWVMSYTMNSTNYNDTLPGEDYNPFDWMTADQFFNYGIHEVTLTAYFNAMVIDTLTVVLGVNNTAWGTTDPVPGTYYFTNYDTQATFEAIPADGYYYDGWVLIVDGDADTLRGSYYQSLALNVDYCINAGLQEVELIALFSNEAPAPDTLEVTLAVNDATMGSITPAPGTYQYLSTDTITVNATPAPGYYFYGWVRDITIPGYYPLSDTVITANAHYVEAIADGLVYWMEYYEGLTYAVTALFTDDSTMAPELDSMKVVVAVNDPTMGTTNPAPGVHYFYEGENASVVAIPNAGYYLEGWTIYTTYHYVDIEEGMDTIVVVIDTTVNFAVEDFFSMFEDGWLVEQGDGGYEWNITANFAVGQTPIEHDSLTLITAVNNDAWGTITPAPGTHYYVDGEQFTISATANEGYYLYGFTFAISHPLYGELDNETIAVADVDPDTLAEYLNWVVDEDMMGFVVSITALFQPVEGIEEVEVDNFTVSVDESTIVVRGAEGKPVALFDVNGRMLNHQTRASERVEFRVNNSGVYLVKVADAAAKRVVVVR